MYLSRTDYIQHKAPRHAAANDFYAMIDRNLARSTHWATIPYADHG